MICSEGPFSGIPPNPFAQTGRFRLNQFMGELRDCLPELQKAYAQEKHQESDERDDLVPENSNSDAFQQNSAADLQEKGYRENITDDPEKERHRFPWEHKAGQEDAR